MNKWDSIVILYSVLSVLCGGMAIWFLVEAFRRKEWTVLLLFVPFAGLAVLSIQIACAAKTTILREFG